MAKPVNASSDIWYRSVDDLLSALDTGRATAASTALAINLQTSAVPLDLSLKAALQFEGLHVYRLLHRLDNGLPQFQLRLGIIESDLQADAILAIVRKHYPGATKKTVGDADRTAIARMVSSARSAGTAGSPDSIRPPARQAAAAVPLEDTPAPSRPPKASATEDLQWNIDEVLRHLINRPTQAREEPSPEVGVTAVASATAVPGSTEDSGELRSIVDRIGALSVAAEDRREARAARTASGSSPSMAPPELPAIDSTQTVRALTSFELDEEAQTSRWFVLQLMHSPEQIDPEQVPNLDIFSEYRLYAVGESNQRGFGYALRLGFFSSEVAAGAVAAYLAPHFPSTDIKRVSLAEHERFVQNVVVAKKDVGLAGSHAVIEFSSPRALPQVPADTAASIGARKPPAEAAVPEAATSLWSRLTQRRVSRE